MLEKEPERCEYRNVIFTDDISVYAPGEIDTQSVEVLSDPGALGKGNE